MVIKIRNNIINIVINPNSHQKKSNKNNNYNNKSNKKKVLKSDIRIISTGILYDTIGWSRSFLAGCYY